jgi:hypothetical protein
VIENVNCFWDEPRLRDCSYSNYTMALHSCPSGGGVGVRCKVIRNIKFVAVNNSVLITWEYSNNISRQLSSFDVRCNGQRHYTSINIISMSNETSRVSYTVGDLLPNASYDCCVSAKYGTTITEVRCASIRSEELFSSTNISDTNMAATVVGAVLGCIIIILLVLLAVCGGALFHLLRSRTSSAVNKR